MYYNDQDPLFSTYDLMGYIQSKNRGLENYIKSLSLEKLSSDQSGLINELLERYALHIPILEDKTKIVPEEADITVRSQIFEGEYVIVKGLKIKIEVGFSGDPEIFKCQPSTFTLSGKPHAQIDNNKLILTYTTTEKDPEKIKQAWTNNINEIKQHLDWIEKDLTIDKKLLEGKIKNLLDERKKEAASNQSLINLLKQD
jgi:hypothetical protein